MTDREERERKARAEIVEMFGEEVASKLDLLEAHTLAIGRIMNEIIDLGTLSEDAITIFRMSQFKAVANELDLDIMPMSDLIDLDNNEEE